jgi:flagellar basal body L-ring protein FlgH
MKHVNKLLAALAFTAIASVASADSLFSQSTAKDVSVISEKVDRFEVGDIITVIVRETLNATTSAGTNTKKESEVASTAPAAANPFLVGQKPDGNNILNPGELPNWDIEAENETKNTGDTRRRNTLTTSITCTVVEVFPNGNLKIAGDKKVTVNRDDSMISVTGIIRSKDITAENTIQSTQVAVLSRTPRLVEGVAQHEIHHDSGPDGMECRHGRQRGDGHPRFV